MLPLGSASAALLAGCGGDDDTDTSPNPGTPTATFTTAEFIGMSAPTLAAPAAMATTTVGSELKVSFSDGSSQTYKLAYQPFFITGDKVPDGKGGTVLAGGYFDIHNQPIVDRSVPGSERQFFSDCVDGSSLLTLADANVPGVKGKPVFAVVQFEYTTRDQAGASTYGMLPSPIAILTLDQDPATGKLTLVKYHNVDTSPARGLWITCGASLSPWNTHLSSEEYEPDAFTIASNTQFQRFSTYTFGDPTAASPYDYGHLPEVTVNPDGTGSIVKHYCLGRISHELVCVAPDERTVLMGDDATNGGAFMFIADRARDLSSGTLYVGKWNQTSGTGPGSATLSWIPLGHATSDEIRALVRGGIQATDIFDVKTTDPADAGRQAAARTGPHRMGVVLVGRASAVRQAPDGLLGRLGARQVGGEHRRRIARRRIAAGRSHGLGHELAQPVGEQHHRRRRGRQRLRRSHQAGVELGQRGLFRGVGGRQAQGFGGGFGGGIGRGGALRVPLKQARKWVGVSGRLRRWGCCRLRGRCRPVRSLLMRRPARQLRHRGHRGGRREHRRRDRLGRRWRLRAGGDAPRSQAGQIQPARTRQYGRTD